MNEKECLNKIGEESKKIKESLGRTVLRMEALCNNGQYINVKLIEEFVIYKN